MTRDDLEDILGFDGVAAFFGGFGLFMLSGAVWLIVENTLDKDGFSLDPLMSFCAAAVIFGVTFLATGAYFHSKKRGRIKRIFDQTKRLSDSGQTNSS